MRRVLSPLPALALAFALAAAVGCVGSPEKNASEGFESAGAASDSRPAPDPGPPIYLERRVASPRAPAPGGEAAEFAFAGNGMEIRQAILALFRSSDMSVLVDPSVEGEVTFDFRGSTPSEALASLASWQGLSLRVEGDTVVVGARETRTFPLDFIGPSTQSSGAPGSGGGASGGGSSGEDADSGSSTIGGGSSLADESIGEVWEQVRQEVEALKSEDGTFVVNSQTGEITVTDSPAALDRIGRRVEALEETLGRQVMVEAELFEITLNDDYRQGVRWALFPGAFGMDEEGLLEDGAMAASLLGAGGTALRFGILDPDNYAAALDFLSTHGQTRVLSRPRLATLSNRTAWLTVAEQVPVIERTIVDSLSGSRTEFDVRFEDAGVLLSLTPFVGSDGQILVSLVPSVTEVVGFVRTPDGLQTEPILSLRETKTMIRVRDGQTIVIGGVRSKRKTESVEKIPYLGDVPIIGQVFRSTVQNEKETELVVMVTPRRLDGPTIDAIRDQDWERFEAAKRPYYPGELIRPEDEEPLRDDGTALRELSVERPPPPSPPRSVPDGEAMPPSPLAAGAGTTPDAILMRGDVARAMARRAADNARAGRLDTARRFVEQALEFDGGNAEAIEVAALVAARAGHWSAARERLVRLAAERPDDPIVLNNLAAVHLNAHQPDRAVPLLETASDREPKSAILATNLGIARLRTGDLAGAERAFERALAARPDLYEARRGLAAIAARREPSAQPPE